MATNDSSVGIDRALKEVGVYGVGAEGGGQSTNGNRAV